MTMNDFMADGWSYEVDDGEEASLDSNSYLLLGADFANKDGKLVRVEVINYSNRKMKLDDCYITGFSYPTYGTSEDRAAVKFAKGIEVQKSKTDDVKSAYGDPTTYDTNSNSTTFNYKFNDSFYTSYTFNFNADNVMIGFDVTNRVEVPENFVQAPVSDVAPDYIDSYKAPTELGNDVVSGKIQVDKVIYQLPCPLKAFIDDGWKVDDEEGEYESVDSNDYESIYLLKQGYEIEVKVENDTDLALPTEYCQVTYIYTYTSKVKDLEIVLPGGISMKSKAADLQKVMKNNDNKDNYKAYRNDKEDDYNHYATVYYDNDDDKVLSIVLTYGNDDNS